MRSQHSKMTCTGEMGQEAQPSSQPFRWLQPGIPGQPRSLFSCGPVPAATHLWGGTKWGLRLQPCWKHPECTATVAVAGCCQHLFGLVRTTLPMV